MPIKDPDDKRRDFLIKFDNKVVRMEDELQRMIKLLAFQREVLENRMFSGQAYNMEEISDRDVKTLKEMTASFNSLTDAKIRLDKTAKQRAEQMSPEEEKEAVLTYLKALPMHERSYLIKQIVVYHNSDPTKAGKEIGEDRATPVERTGH